MGALDGISVVDLSRVLAGPLVAMTLGDLGADVVKVESPLGDDTRSWKPPVDAQGRASYHHTANRNKRSIVLDFDVAEDLELVQSLCREADVVVSNFKPGTLSRFELDHDQLPEHVVSCEIAGMGGLPGYDPLVQAVGGLMSITGPPGSPSKVGVAIVDVVAALYATVGVLAALRVREQTGRGQRVTVDLLHASLALLANQASGYLASGVSPVALGNVHPSIEPFAVYPTGDGELMILAGNDGQFRRLCDTLGFDPDARFATNSDRVANREALHAELVALLADRSAAEWRELLTAAGVPAGPVQTIGEAFSLAETLGLDVVDETDGVRTVAFPARLSETPASVRLRPPELDEHRDELRRS